MSDFLFRPISAMTRTLRSAARSSYKEEQESEKEEAMTKLPAQEENEGLAAKEKETGAARAAAETFSNTVSPPMEESSANLADTGENRQEETLSVATTDAAAAAAAVPKRKRRPNRSELDKLKSWADDEDDEEEDTESTNRSLRMVRFDGINSTTEGAALEVTPSPRQKRRKVRNINVASFPSSVYELDENVARLPRKRDRRTDAASVAEMTEAPRRTMPQRKASSKKRNQASLMVYHETDEKKPFAAKPASTRRQWKVPKRLQADFSLGEEMEFSEESSSDGDKKPAAKKRRRPPSKLVQPESFDKSAVSSTEEQLGKNGAMSLEDEFDESDEEEINNSDDSLSGGENPVETKQQSGGWSDLEKLLFLYGVKVHGRGNWTMISKTIVRSRSPKQVKWYGTKVFNRKVPKKNMFAPLKGKTILLEALSKGEESNHTPWSDGEKLLFLYGLKKLGRGKWHELRDGYLRSRDRHQIRNFGRRIFKRAKGGDDIFAPLAGKELLIEELVQGRVAVLIPVNSRMVAEDFVDIQRRPEKIGWKPRKIARKPKAKSAVPILHASAANSYDADAVERIALAKIASDSQEVALKFCVNTLKSWYAYVEDLAESLDESDGTNRTELDSLRNGITKLWCVLTHLVTNVLEPPGNQVQGQRKDAEGRRVAALFLDIAISCPFVGNHHEIIQARVNLEFDQYSFLQTVNSESLAGFAEAVRSVDSQQEKLLEALSSTTAMCNDAIRISPMHRAFSLDIFEDSVASAGIGGQHGSLILDSVAKLGECVAFIRSSWPSSHHMVADHTSSSILSREANRLSRVKEALLKSDEDSEYGIEYGCDCGCWLVFSNKSELFEHRKSCRGQAIAIEGHEKFARKKFDNHCVARSSIGEGALYNQVHILQKLETSSLKAKGGAKKWNVPRLKCWEVEYGCDCGCLCVFATKQELLDHQRTCVDGNSASLKKVPSPVDADERDETPAQLTVEE